MIIRCENCSKKFNLDEKLIPENGRMLQCSSCNHKWHYRIPDKGNYIKENIILPTKNEQIINNDNQETLINPSLIETSVNKPLKKSNIKTHRKLNNKKKKLDKEKNIEKKNSLNNTLNVLVVLIITFVAVILILDTFKNNISNYFPIIITLMDNLYETLFDVKSFIKDLIS